MSLHKASWPPKEVIGGIWHPSKQSDMASDADVLLLVFFACLVPLYFASLVTPTAPLRP